MTQEAGQDEKEPRSTSEPQRPRLTMTKLFELLQDREVEKEVESQLTALPEIKKGLDARERQDLRIDNIAKGARLSDLEDDITAHWRLTIRNDKLAKIRTLILSDMVGGIMFAKHLEKGFDNRILLLIGIFVFMAVTYLWGPAISLYLQSNWIALGQNSQTILIVFLIVAIASAVLVFKTRKKGNQ